MLTSIDMNVLVVDDEPALRSIVSEFVKLKGYHPVHAEGGEKALVSIKSELPVLVLCDLSMPEGSGMDLLTRLKEIGMPCAVVILTAYWEQSKLSSCLKLGAIDYLPKPFDTDLLLDKLSVWVAVGKKLNECSLNKKESFGERWARAQRIIEEFRMAQKVTFSSGE